MAGGDGGGDTKIELIQSPSLGLPVVQFHHIPWGWGRSRVPKGICNLVPRRDSKCWMASSSFPHAISPSKNFGACSDSPALVLTSLGLFRFISSHFTPELAASLKEELGEVFNRGFWDGYYQGARLGEWSTVYGNKATRKKTYIGKITNYFSNIGVAEVLVETGELKVGSNILIIGPSTGVIEMKVPEIRVDLNPSDKASKGEYCSIPVGEKLRRSDKVYLFE